MSNNNFVMTLAIMLIVIKYGAIAAWLRFTIRTDNTHGQQSSIPGNEMNFKTIISIAALAISTNAFANTQEATVGFETCVNRVQASAKLLPT